MTKNSGPSSSDNRKDPEKIAEKARRPSILAKKPWHDVEHIRDAYRFKTILGDVRDLDKIVDRLNESGIEVVKYDVDKVLKPGEWGWRIAAFDLRMPNGQLVEWYVPVRELEAAKKHGHHLFELWRNHDVTKLTPDEARAREATLQEFTRVVSTSVG